MNEQTLKYIRKHDYIYWYLREDSTHYMYLYQDNKYVYTLKKIAKEHYKLRYTDKMERLSNKMDILNAFIDVFK